METISFLVALSTLQGYFTRKKFMSRNVLNTFVDGNTVKHVRILYNAAMRARSEKLIVKDLATPEILLGNGCSYCISI